MSDMRCRPTFITTKQCLGWTSDQSYDSSSFGTGCVLHFLLVAIQYDLLQDEVQ
jgi:hypothetical protein